MNDEEQEQGRSEQVPLLRKTKNRLGDLFFDFKNFIDKGSVIDLAVGLVIGNAFSEVVTSMVSDLLTPIFGLVINSKLSETFLVIRKGPHYPYNTREEAKTDKAITWNYGNFIQLTMNFVMISASLFLVIKMYHEMKRKNKDKKIENQIMKECPFCFTGIDGRAIKCPSCTGDLE